DEIVGIDSRLNHRGKRMTSDENDLPTSPAESWPPQPIQPNKTPNHWRAVAAVASAIAIIALFALLLRGFAGNNGANSPADGTDGTATANVTANATTSQTAPAIGHGKWQVMDNMTYSATVFTLTPYPVFSPIDPNIVYETSTSPFPLRRSDDGGATWTPVDMPASADQAIVIEIWASPLDAHTAFLTVTVNLAYGQGPDACPSSALASAGGATHGNILASGQVPCSTTYRSTDEGSSWKAISFPVNGTISTPYSDSAPYAGTPIQAQGTRLYAMLSCGPSCVSPGGRLVTSTNGGATWQVADAGGLGQGVCDFTAQPNSETIFAAVSRGSCDMLNSPVLALDRSDDAGNNWVHVSFLPQGASQGMASVIANGKPLLVINLPAVNWQPHIIGVTQSADEFLASSDGGSTWKKSPLAGTPDKAVPIIAPLIVRADGSLVASFTTQADLGQAAKIYSWKPGETSWRVIAPAPEGRVSTLRYTVYLSGEEAFWAVITSASKQVGNTQLFTYVVDRYAP
ncbi:MAG TPA: sialidase family protein, partial [Ktedonobacterales bacterium]|nr:sialidase family protein [Ktedonobacterales bacterium]